MTECSKVLLAGDAERVDVFTLAHAIKRSEMKRFKVPRIRGIDAILFWLLHLNHLPVDPASGQN